MPTALRLRPLHRLLTLFLAATLVPAAALVWLGWQLIDQDRRLERQRVQDALEAAASGVAAGLERELGSLDRSLTSLLTTGPGALHADTAVAVRLTRSGLAARAGAPLLYLPAVPPPAVAEPSPTLWTKAERLEFVQKDLTGAMKAYRALVNTADPGARAGTLLRLARVLRKAGRNDEALAAYTAMTALTGATVDGDPADLMARWARIGLLDRLRRPATLQAEATALRRDLSAGRWPIDRTTYLAYADGLEPQADPSSRASAPALALSEAVASTWNDWRAGSLTAHLGSGRRSKRAGTVSTLLLWREEGDALLLFAATSDYVTTEWRSLWPGDGMTVSLVDEEGTAVIGNPPSGSAQLVVKPSLDTRLPWTVRVSAAATPEAIASSGAVRRRLLLAGLVLLAVLVPATGYLVNRAVQRELAVVKQQADFVSAVSHEFRSPLTSLTHLTSLLRGDFQPTDERRRQYYDVLARETDRLRRFVETLLDFGRMQAGAARYRLTHLALAPFVRQLVEEFSTDAAAGRHTVSFDMDEALPAVSADAEALGRAIWNLLENAAKYSPDDTRISVRVERERDSVAIRVRDQGSGIPAHEQPYVFQQFFRGAAAVSSAVKGTGVGLAVAQHIVHAHGGQIRLESEPGTGSTFSILLPAQEAETERTSRRAS